MPSVKVGEVQVNYEVFGEGRPLLVIHGFPGNGRMFEALFEPFLKERNGWRRFYPDLLDYGDGGIPASVNSSDALVDILIGFMEAVAPGERYVVAGASWGGYLGRSLVQRALNQIDGVHLLAPMMDWTIPVLPEQPILHLEPEFVAALQPGEEWLAGSFAVQNKGILDKFRPEVLGNWKEVSQEASAPLWNSTFASDPDALLPPCLAPALIVCGRQDGIVGYKQTWSIVENFPRGTFVALDRTGHWIFYEQAALYHALIHEWLDRVEEYAATSHPAS
jgi:pimeloyl-ACP methyl ester carboxylesterase